MTAADPIVLTTGANQGLGFEVTSEITTDDPSYHVHDRWVIATKEKAPKPLRG